MKYYIFNRQGELAATADVAPNMEDLSARGEQAIESEFEFVNPIFSNGEIIERGIAPTHYHTWNGRAWEIDETKQQAVISAEKSAKREQINRKRDDVCFGGIYIETLGKWFDTDETSFVKMIGAKSVMDDDFANGQEVKPELWICADNSIVQLGRDELALIIRSIKQNVSAMHAVAVQHKMELEQSEKPSEYDFSAGWSKTYQEFLNEQTN